MKKIPDSIKELSAEQIQAYSVLVNLDMKIKVTWCILAGFFILLILLIVLIVCPAIKSTWSDKAIVGAVDSIIGYTTYPLVKHYLPAIGAAISTK